MSNTKFETIFTPQKRKTGQKFGDIFVIKKGKKINVREATNAANVDCEIYETLEKYDMIQTHERKNLSEIINEIGQIDLLTSLEKMQKGKELWNNLPQNIKDDFKNDVHKFIDNGVEYFNAKIKAAEEAKRKAEEEKKQAEEKARDAKKETK